jgi:hypothetical protein
MFLAVQPFSYNSVWFAGVYLRGCIPKILSIRAITKVVRNTYRCEFTSFMMAPFVRAAEWPQGFGCDKKRQGKIKQNQY